MAKVKSIITEADVSFMTNPEIHFVSLVGHAANRQPFKIIKGQIKGDDNMPKKTIFSVLVPKTTTEEKLQEIVSEHKFSVEEKDETSLSGYDVYIQAKDEDIDPDSKKIAKLEDDVFIVVADLKEDSEKEGTEKDEFNWETYDTIADSLFAMCDIVLGSLRQPEADGTSRKDIIFAAISNFTKHAEAFLSTMKAEDVVENIEVKSEIIKSLLAEKEEVVPEVPEVNEDIQKATEEIEILKKQLEDIKNLFEETKETLNKNINECLEAYTKKEDVDVTVAEIKDSIEQIKTSTFSRKSDIDEKKPPVIKQENKKRNTFVTFV
jgi:hypothetical protein